MGDSDKSSSRNKNSSRKTDGAPNTRSRQSPSLTTDSAEPTGIETAVSRVLKSDSGLLQQLQDTVAKILVEQVLQSTKLARSVAEAVCKNDAFMDQVSQRVYESVQIDHDTLKKKVDSNDKSQKTTTNELRNQIKKANEKIDDLEQYSRRNCLLVHGIEEVQNENTTDVAVNSLVIRLNLNITADDIDRSHRIGKRELQSEEETPKTRPIIVKFVSYARRAAVFSAKRHLKGTGISVTESLTPRRMDILRAAKDSTKIDSVWSMDGRINCITTAGRRITLKNVSDIEKL